MTGSCVSAHGFQWPGLLCCPMQEKNQETIRYTRRFLTHGIGQIKMSQQDAVDLLFIVRMYDVLHQLVTNHIGCIQVNKINA